MTTVTASAPGKLVLTGEYAVLEGAPAVVLALDRRAVVTLSDSEDAECHIDAPTLDIQNARGRLDQNGHMQWSELNETHRAQLALVSAVIEAAATSGTSGTSGTIKPFRATLDTRAFFAADATQGKWGVGSSAALTVALAGALHEHNQRGKPTIDTLLAAHRRVQHGRGSGLDIATSLTGGALVYRLHDNQPDITPVTWPASLQLACIWSGRSASTGAMLQQLAAWREQSPTAYIALMVELATGAEAAANAISTGDVHTLLNAAALYANTLDRLGQASGLDIVCAEHRAITAIATSCGVVYKTSGAGGGDIGIALSDDSERLQQFCQRVRSAGFLPLDIAPDARGLRLQSAISQSPTKNGTEGWTSAA
ncbi:MAG: hypothetical protein ABI114_06330 [Rhodanobacter sp.]